jgi:hypothetical protein
MVSDNDVKGIVKDIILNHRGSDNPISSREINEEIGVDNIGSFPSTRAIVRELVLEDQIPIASSNQGYYVVETEDEIAEYIDNLSARIDSIAERRFAIQRAAKKWDEPIESSEDEDLL